MAWWWLLPVAVAWSCLLRLAWEQGHVLRPKIGRHLGIGAAPFVGRWERLATWRLVLPAILAVAVVAYGPRFVTRVRWRWVSIGAAATSVAWVVALALVDGRQALTSAIGSRYDYLAVVPRARHLGGYLATFTDRIDGYPTHVKGHPPGTVIVLWALDRLGLGGTGPALVLVLAGGAVAVVSVLAAARALAGDRWARRAAVFVALAPGAMFATNTDLFFTGLAAGGVALVVLSASAERTGRRRVLAGCAGVVLGAGVLCSYSIALFAVPVVVVIAVRRRPDVGVLVAAAAAAVVALPALWGFWLLDGLAATRVEYLQGLGGRRPAGYFAWADLVAFGALIGPAGMVAVARLRQRRLWPVVGGTLAVVALATASQLSKGEVERIWQPYAPWLLLACGGLVTARATNDAEPTPSRFWLAANAGTGLALVFALRSPW